MARKLQNPLANIKAVMTDNAIGFNTGTDNGTSYGFQIQPVYAMDFPDKGFTFIPRGVIPILGLEPGARVPRIVDGGVPGTDSVWGLGDSIFQTFFAPHTENKVKWGLGPQLSLPTATDSRLAGPGWGAGIGGVITGAFSEELSYAALISNHWSFNDGYNVLTVQPMLYYNIAAVSGMVLSYNAPISYDWNASSGNEWTVPLGLTVGRTFAMKGGHGLDLSIGGYYNVVRPDGAADWQMRFGVTWIFP